MAAESKFQKQLKEELRYLFPGCVILKGNSAQIQGFPDLLILYKDRYAGLEVKASETSPHQPNQDWWVRELENVAFAAFIYPENKEEILDALQSTFRAPRNARRTQRVQVPVDSVQRREVRRDPAYSTAFPKRH